jgi:hypothetical protein
MSSDSTHLTIDLPEAEATRLEQLATNLLSAFKPFETGQSQQREWEPDRPAVGEVHVDDSQKPVWRGEMELDGYTVKSLSFFWADAAYTLAKDVLPLLDNLAEQWAFNPHLKDLSTTEQMKSRLMQWCAQELRFSHQSRSMDFVLNDLRSDLAEHEVWVLLAGIDVEGRLPVGKVELRGVGVEHIEQWSQSLLNHGLSPDAVEHHKKQFAEMWQGQTAAIHVAWGDRSAVEAAALEHAERACALLRVVDPKSPVPRSRSYLQPVRLMSQAHVRVLLTDPLSKNVSTSMQMGLNNEPVTLTIQQKMLPALWEQGGLKWIHELLCAHPRSAFQEHLLGAALIYSRHRLTEDPIEKLIFAISGMETVLFAGKRGLNQETTKKRLSGSLAGSTTFRDHIDQVVKAAYGLRNGFLHHGHRIAELKAVQDFLQLGWLFFRRTLAVHSAPPTIDAYCTSLDEAYRTRFAGASPP